METKGRISYIKQIINGTNDIAFVVGNGILLHCNNGNTEDYLSWKALLSFLYTGKKDKIEIPDGISYTEFFDILELKKWNEQKKEHQKQFIEATKSIIKLGKKIDLNKLNGIAAMLGKNIILDAQKSIDLVDIFKDYQIQERMKKLTNTMRSSLSDLGVENIDKLSDSDCLYLSTQIATDEYLKFSLKSETKKEIKSLMDTWKTNQITQLIISKIKEKDVPILTTNYDNVLSKSVNATIYKMQPISNKGTKFSDFYPWNCYYSNKEQKSPTSGFGIWHINGMIKYHRSIVLGLADYMGCVSKARKMLQGHSIFDCDTFNGKNQNYWNGWNTWLHIFFNKSLFIFGLSLEENEVFLRWLLIQRTKYFSSYGIQHKGWYVYFNGKEDMSKGKKLFLESVGFEVIEIHDYKTIYEDVWR